MSLFINPHTKKALAVVKKQRPHALVLVGPVGIGLSALAQEYIADTAATVITVLPEKDDKIDIEKGAITVQRIRHLYEVTRTIEPAGRVIVIDYAERMAIPAQNAFLKLLEEPTEGTSFVLLTHQPELLLSTIRSRVQRIDIRPITTEQSEALLDELHVDDVTKRTQLLFIADGRPAELVRLSRDNALFEARAALVKDARTYITGGAYDRLLLAKKYKDTRGDALILVEDATKLLRRTIAAKGDSASLALLIQLEQLHKRLSEQGNIRLQLSSVL